MRVLLALMSLLACCVANSASAAEVFSGIYSHGAKTHITVCCFEPGPDVEIGLSGAPIRTFGRWGGLRPYVLGSINTRGGVDFAAAGVTLRIPLGKHVYLEPGLGGAIQSGDDAQVQKTPHHLYLGSRFLFEPQGAIGYEISPRWAVEASWVHLSHAQLAGPQNPGLDDFGVRVIKRF